MESPRQRRLEPSLLAARESFRLAFFEEAARRLRALMVSDNKIEAAHAALLLVRIELKHDPEKALRTLADIRQTRGTSVRAEASMLKGVACARLGRRQAAKLAFDAATALSAANHRLSQEVVYQRSAAAWIERKLDKAEQGLNRLTEPLDVELDTQVRVLRGAIASAREDLPTQGAILLDALRGLRAQIQPNVHHRAVVASQLASLAVELPSRELLKAADEELASVPWTPDIADLHFEALRSLAWRHALEGDEFNAFRRLKEAVSVAPSNAWRVAVLADRAYLAAVLGEPRWAAQELRDAHELATNIDWALVAGEEKLALPQLAELFAESDPTVATGYVTTFEKVGKRYPRVLSSHRDRRVEAAESYALGCVQVALGELVGARRSLTHAWRIYDRFGIRWRAARTASAIARVDRSDLWRARSQSAADAYPRSWLARNARMSPIMSANAVDVAGRLTVAQRQVFDLLLQGRDTQSIAVQLGRSTFTVRNHIKAIFKTCAVTSRPALIVKFASTIH